MRKFVDKAKQSLTSHSPVPQTQIPTQPIGPPSAPTPLDTLRYRSHHGTNLGSIFVLEKWLFPSMFEPNARGDSELDAVTAYGPSQLRADHG